MLLVGNKCDLEEERAFTIEEATKVSDVASYYSYIIMICELNHNHYCTSVVCRISWNRIHGNKC